MMLDRLADLLDPRRSTHWSSTTAAMSTSDPTSIRQLATPTTSWNDTLINEPVSMNATDVMVGEAILD